MESEVLRHLDSLGRIVLPKNMRKRLLLSEGDPVEVSLEKNHIVIRPFMPLTELEGFFSLCLKTAEKRGLRLIVTSRIDVLFSLTDGIPKGTFLSKAVSALITSRKVQHVHEEMIPISEGLGYYVQSVFPVISYGELYGSIIAVSTEKEALTEEQEQYMTVLCELITEEIGGSEQ